MAKGSSSSDDPLPQTFPVFVKSSLDTNLAMALSPADTVGDLKGKITTEHAICFPSCGEITVNSIKIRRRGCFYHLSDSMLVKSAFDGINGTRFLHMDAVSMSRQDGASENPMHQNVGQYQKHQLLGGEPNASKMGICSARVQAFITNGSTDGKEPLQTDTFSAHGEQAVLDTRPQTLSVHKFSLPHAAISNNLSVRNDSNADALSRMYANTNTLHGDPCTSLLEPEKRSDTDLPELAKPVQEANVTVGSHLELQSEQADDLAERDGREDDHNNLIVSTKKKKSRKRRNVSNDPLLENDGSFVQKKKHKKDLHNSLEEPLAKSGNSMETPILENIHPETSFQDKLEKDSISLEQLCTTPSPCNDSLPKAIASGLKKRMKKKEGAIQVDNGNSSAISESGPSERSLENTVDVASFRKQVTEENSEETLISNQRNAGHESDAALFNEKSTRITTNGGSIELGTVYPLPTNLKQSDFNAAVTIQEAPLLGNTDSVYSEDLTNSSNSKEKSKNESSRKASSSLYSLLSSGDHFSGGNVEEASGNTKKDSNKESSVMVAIGEPVDLRNPSGESELPSDANVRSSHRSRRKRSDKTELSNRQSHTHGAVHSSIDQFSGDNPKEIPGNQHRDSANESKLREAEVLGKAAAKDSTTHSNPNERSSRHRRKKTPKAELVNHDSIGKEPLCSLMKEATEEKAEGASVGVDKHKGEETKSETIRGETTHFKIPFNRESSMNVSSKFDSLHSSVDNVNEDNLEEASRNTNSGLNKESDAMATIGEPVGHRNPADQSEFLPKANVRSSHRSKRKKSDKTEVLNLQSHTYGATHLSRGHVSEDNPDEIPSYEPKDSDKGSKLGESTVLGKAVEAAAEDPTTNSNPKERVSSRRRKKTAKSDLDNNDSIGKEPSPSLMKGDTEDKVQESLVGFDKIKGKESRLPAILEETASFETSMIINSAIPSKRESSRDAPNMLDSLHSSGDQINEENHEEASGNTEKDLNKESDAMATIGEPMSHKNPSGESKDSPNGIVPRLHQSKKKKSDKTESSTLQSHTHGAVHPSEQVSGDNPNEIPGYQSRVSDKESKLGEVGVLGKDAVENSTTHSISNGRSLRHRRKKAAKAVLVNHNSIVKDPLCILTKGDTEENSKNTLGGSDKQKGEVAKSATILETPIDMNLANLSNISDRNSRKPKRKKGKAEFPCSFSNHDLNGSSGNQSLHENLQKTLGTTHGDPINESNGGATPDETTRIMDRENHNNVDSTGLLMLNDSPKGPGSAHHFMENVTEENLEGLLEKTHENSGKETRKKLTHERRTESIEANDHTKLPNSDPDKISFIEFFVPKAGQVEALPLGQPVDTEMRKSHKKKIGRKRKSKFRTKDFTHEFMYSPSSDEQHMLKKRYEEREFNNQDLVDSVGQHTADKSNGKNPHDEETVKGLERSTLDVHVRDLSSGLGATKNLHDEDHNTDKHLQISVARHEQSMHVTESIHNSIFYLGDKNIMDSVDENRSPKNSDAVISSSPIVEPDLQNCSSRMKETIDDPAASSDTTEEDTSYQQKRYRVTVRKAPSKTRGKIMNNAGPEKTLLGFSGTIFSEDISGSSEDEFEFVSRKATSKTMSDNSSTSAESDGNLEETPSNPRDYMESPGVDSVVQGKHIDGVDDIVLTQPSSVRKKNMPLSKILRSTSSYRKAKLTASQSQHEDSESQPVAVSETQPEDSES